MLLTRSQRLPLERGTLTIPSSEPAWRYPLLTGQITITGDSIEWWIDCGPAEFFIIDVRDGTEIVTYADETRYHGTGEALIAAGVCTRQQLPMGKQTQRSSASHFDGPEFEWRRRRQPDGLFVLRIESEAARARRVAKWRALAQREGAAG